MFGAVNFSYCINKKDFSNKMLSEITFCCATRQ